MHKYKAYLHIFHSKITQVLLKKPITHNQPQPTRFCELKPCQVSSGLPPVSCGATNCSRSTSSHTDVRARNIHPPGESELISHGKRPGIPWSFWHPKPGQGYCLKQCGFCSSHQSCFHAGKNFGIHLIIIPSLHNRKPCGEGRTLLARAVLPRTKLPLETTHAPRHTSPFKKNGKLR